MKESESPYIIITSTNTQELIKTINEYMLNAYQPLGGLAVETVSNGYGIQTRYYQAMIKPTGPILVDKRKKIV